MNEIALKFANETGLDTFPMYLAFLLTGVAIWAVGLFLYEKITPVREFEEIREGNIAIGWNMLGVMVGMALPIISVGHSTFSLMNLAFWGAVGVAIQLIAHFVFRFVFKKIYTRMCNQRDCAASGLFLGGIALVVGLINAASLSA